MGNLEIYEEGEFIENTTAFAFMFSGVLLLFLSLNRSGLEGLLTLTFSVTCLMFFVREVDIEDLNVPYTLQLVGSGRGRDILFLLLYLLIGCGVFVFKKRHVDFKFRALFRSEVAIVVIVGCVCLLMGDVLQHFDVMMAEEILEMDGALLILLAAIIHIRTPIWGGQAAAANPGTKEES